MISFQEALDIVDQKVNQIEYPDNKGLYEPIRYILSLRGKKVRPVLALLACNLYSEKIDDAIMPALAWEIFHNFTLIHDDLMDKAELRRNMPVVHKVWNENTAILSGDSMLILAYQYIGASPAKYLKVLLDLFSATAANICEGQQYDMEFESRLDVSETEYLEMIRLKTAVLLGASLKSGAIVGGASEKDALNLYNFGVNIGLAFQIKDDLLDVYADSSIFGKSIGGDILCNKKTYLLTQALMLAEGCDKDNLLQWITTVGMGDNNEKINAVTAIYNKLGIKELSEDKMNYFYQEALKSLSLVEVKDNNKVVLLNFAKQLMEREF